MNAPVRQFTAALAVRDKVPLLVGLMGPSGGGKTYSALRLARGIQEVVGGEIYMIDTEAKRGTHYADEFKKPDGSPGYYHVPFGAPFGSLDYLAALRHCLDKGARTIIVDSMSHEHEGPGGLLDLHEQELTRMIRGDERKRESMKMLAWGKPKANRRELINGLLQMECNFVFCFRAKNSVKPVKVTDPESGRTKTEVVPQGFVPIAGDDLVFEMTLNALLLPGADGFPTWKSENVGERTMIKVPKQFRGLVDNPRQLDERLGKALAVWAQGGKSTERSDAADTGPPPDRSAFSRELREDAPRDEPTGLPQGGFGAAAETDGEDEPSAAVAWGRQLQEDLEGDVFKTTSDLDGFTADPANAAMFAALDAERPEFAKRLNAAIRGRGKALAGRRG